MRASSIIVAFLAGSLTACAVAERLGIGAAPESKRKEFDIARMERADDDEERPSPVIDHEESQRLIRERFPGAKRLDFVRVVVWPEPRSGPCWTDITHPSEMKMETSYSIEGKRKELEASGFPEHREQGWRGIYRTPAGTGFEMTASFRSIDMTVGTEYACHCMTREGVAEGSRMPLRLRLRWQGEGHMPEVSASLLEDGKARGLKAGFSTGQLFTYEFPVRGAFPDNRHGSCGGNLMLSLLIDPPML